MIKWSDKYKVGFSVIDKQHKKLFEIARKAKASLDRDNDDKYEEVHDILDELVLYATVHFATEEKLMKQIAYHDYEKHRREHEQFLEKIEDIVQDANLDVDDATIREILQFIVEWIIDHICGKDKHMATAIKNHR
ncbi:MAG: hypothetical protein ATN36_01680 [Epulopiscium sp. Nele67-Bin005]|nr:MAG: hypothetical protein ATN36_01680 [Epulopiscium sp. Nele67-Bin005]